MKKASIKYESYIKGNFRIVRSAANGYAISINLKRMEGTCAISERLLEQDCEVIKFENVRFVDEFYYSVRNFFITVNKNSAELVKKGFGIK
jgi:hypothetical protein